MTEARRSRGLRWGGLRSLAVATFALSVCVSVGCDELVDVERNVCGNAVVERRIGEECDAFADPAIAEGPNFQAACAELTQYYATTFGRQITKCVPACAAADEANACQLVWGEATDENDQLVLELCPDGFGYGSDGVCRRASGHFDVEPFLTLPAGGFDGSAADLDGDGISDLLVTVAGGNNSAHGTYIQAGGLALGPVPIGPPPAVGQLSDDTVYGTDIDDLVLPLGGAIVTLRGAPGPSFDPKAYTPFPFDGDIPVPGWSKAGARVLFALASPDDFSVPYVVADLSEGGQGVQGLGFLEVSLLNYSPTSAPFALPNVHLTEVVPRLGLPSDAPSTNILSADVLVDAQGGEAVLATSSTVYAISEAIPLGKAFQPKPGATIETLLPVANWPVPAVAAVVQGSPRPQIALLQRATSGDPIFRYFDLPEDPDMGVVVAPSAVLAVGDLDGDGDLDVVSNHAVFFVDYETQPVGDVPAVVGNSRLVARGTLGTSWVSARIADLNGDGRMSVVAISDAARVDVILPGTTYAMNPVSLATTARADQLEIADLDGDGIDDILVATEPNDASEGDPCSYEDVGFDGMVTARPSNDDLLIAYGRGAGSPEPFTLAGSVPGVSHLVTGRLRLDQALDAVADVGLQTSCDPSDLTKFGHAGIMLGSQDREVYSPFLPFNGPCEAGGTVVRAAIGDVAPFEDETTSHDDLLILSLRAPAMGVTPTGCEDQKDQCFRYEVTPIASTGDAEFTALTSAPSACPLTAPNPVSLTLSVPVDDAPFESRFTLEHHLPALAVAEIVPGDDGFAEGLTVTSHVVDGALTSTLTLLSLDGGVIDRHLIATGIEKSDTVAKIRTVDIDGDDDLDVIVILAFVEPGLDVRSSSAWLFVNDPTGDTPLSEPIPLGDASGSGGAEVQLSSPVRDVVSMSPPLCPSAAGNPSVDCDPARTMLVVSPYDAQLCADIDATTGAPSVDRACSYIPLGGDPSGNNNIFGAVVGDFDLDGLEDLAVLRELSVTFHRQCPLSDVYANRCTGYFGSGPVDALASGTEKQPGD